MSEASVIEARGLGVVYPGGVRALEGVELSLGSDEFAAVLGPSGAGKSTLLRTINGMVHPTEGSLRVNGVSVAALGGRGLRRMRRDAGMIFQQFNLVGRLTALQNVLAGRLAHTGGPVRSLLSHVRWFTNSDRSIAMEALDDLGLAHKAHERASQLSGGEQQRVAIARLVAQRPRIVLADEPIASLDPASAERVMQSLRQIHESRGIPVLVNLHQPDVAVKYAGRIIGMRQGRVVFDTPSERFSVDGLYGPGAAEGVDGTSAERTGRGVRGGESVVESKSEQALERAV